MRVLIGLRFEKVDEPNGFRESTDGDHHHVHVTDLYISHRHGLVAKNEEDLRNYKASGASDIHEIDEPGGGKRLPNDPDGERSLFTAWRSQTILTSAINTALR